MKAFADDKLNVLEMIMPVFDIVENVVGKGEIACISNFSFSHNVFKRLLSQRGKGVKRCHCVEMVSQISVRFDKPVLFLCQFVIS